MIKVLHSHMYHVSRSLLTSFTFMMIIFVKGKTLYISRIH